MRLGLNPIRLPLEEKEIPHTQRRPGEDTTRKWLSISQEESSPETDPAGTLILNFQPLKRERKNCGFHVTQSMVFYYDSQS